MSAVAPTPPPKVNSTTFPSWSVMGLEFLICSFFLFFFHLSNHECNVVIFFRYKGATLAWPLIIMQKRCVTLLHCARVAILDTIITTRLAEHNARARQAQARCNGGRRVRCRYFAVETRWQRHLVPWKLFLRVLYQCIVFRVCHMEFFGWIYMMLNYHLQCFGCVCMLMFFGVYTSSSLSWFWLLKTIKLYNIEKY